VGVFVANIECRVLVSKQRGLLDEVRHGVFVTLGADIQVCFVCRSGWVSPCPFFPVSLGVVDDP
jgi:MoaA/NifB/PqqE/SkfB family radical SAM enzyme